MAFEKADPRAARAELGRDGEPDDPGADDGDVYVYVSGGHSPEVYSQPA
jgi:hypothetical protein